METASALTVVPPWQVNAAGVVVALNESLCTFINICLREKHKPTGTLVSFYTNLSINTSNMLMSTYANISITANVSSKIEVTERSKCTIPKSRIC